MDFGILGPVCASISGADVALGGAKQRTVLAALLLAEGRVLSNERLTTLLWGCAPPATASAQIHTYVSRLRNWFRPDVEVVRQAPGYLMRLNGAGYDYHTFVSLVRSGHTELRAGRGAAAATCFQQALELWRGPALADVTEFLNEEAAPKLDEARMEALDARIEAELSLGGHRRLVSELTGLVAEHPFREKLRIQLMTALYRCDRQADALQVYEEGRRILAEELGVDPSAALTRAYRAVLTGELGREPGVAVSPGSPLNVWTGVRPCLLPPDIVDFAGRETMLRGLRNVLRPQPDAPVPRTVALVTGMAGAGKTALAVRAAHASRGAFPAGQLYADLGGTLAQPRPPRDILGSFLRALGIAPEAIPGQLDERIQLYRSQLAERHMLVLLDDAADDQQVRALLPGCSRCRVLVTSRRPLAALDGACVTDLGTLEAPAARQLITGIVGSARVGAEPVALAEIVELCGQLPLALRLAAARLAARPRWSLARLARRLRDETRRLDELEVGGASVRRSLQPSFRGLGPRVATALTRLCELDPPAFTVRTAARLLDLPEPGAERLLEMLVEARLLVEAMGDQRDDARYVIHPLVRCFLREWTHRRTADTEWTAGSTQPMPV